MENLAALFQRAPVGWTDILDIVIAAIAIYELLKLMRGTRAVQMGIGVGLLVAVFYLSRWWHLDTVNWLIRNMFGYVVFAAIVLFQNEIRRTLAHLGRARFFRYLTQILADSLSTKSFVQLNLPNLGVGLGFRCFFIIFAF